jgi:predicted metal-dependent phosphotriesterase family hydrolase
MHTALNGKVMTVLGAVTPEELGPVLMHEHLYLDLAASAEGPTPPERVAMLRDECAPLLKQMRELGGRSVVDCGAIPHRAEPAVYTMLAEMTGCHIVLATGFYRQASPDEQNPIGAQRAYRWLDERVVNGSVESLADIMVNEWDAGIRGTQVRPGIIKLAATGRSLMPAEEKAFRAGALAQQRTGLCITTHARAMGAPETQAVLLESAGADLRRVILGHTSAHLVETPWAARWCMERGATLLLTDLRMDGPFAYSRRLVAAIRRFFNEGYGDRLVLGLNWGFNFVPSSMPAYPFTYMFKFTLPRMRELGLEEEAIQQMLARNPARLLAVR